MSTFRAWLWPDHVAGKRETRRLREEYNALYNSHAELLEALKMFLDDAERDRLPSARSPIRVASIVAARNAIHKAGG